MLVPVFRVVAVNVIHVSDLSRPSQSLTLAQTVLQSLQSIADLSESHAMDLFNQCEILAQCLEHAYLKLSQSKSCAYPFWVKVWGIVVLDSVSSNKGSLPTFTETIN